MSESWRRTELPEIVASLARRPGHEQVRILITAILREAFGVGYESMTHELRLPEVRGRVDALFGATVLEFKKDLRQEMPDVLDQLGRYLPEREQKTGQRFVGIATDGHHFAVFEMRGGALRKIGAFTNRADLPEALLAWLEAALSSREDLPPEPMTIQRVLGRDSITYGRRWECWNRCGATCGTIRSLP